LGNRSELRSCLWSGPHRSWSGYLENPNLVGPVPVPVFGLGAKRPDRTGLSNTTLEAENNSEGEDFEEAEGMEEENYGYVIESEAEEGAEEEEEDLGGEDGEEPWEMGDVQAEGFDDL